MGPERLEDRSLLSLAFGNSFGVGGNGAIGVETTGLGVDQSGNRYVTGSYKATVDFGGNGPSLTSTSNGISDGFVAKYSPTGLLLWLKPFGGTSQDRAADVAIDNNGDAFVTGYFQGSVTFDSGQVLNSGAKPAAFFWELNPQGNTIFLDQAQSTGSVQPQSIAVDATGANFVVGGIFTGSLALGTKTLTSTGAVDSFVTKISVSGAADSVTWASQLAAAANNQSQVQSVAIDPSGNVVASGFYQGTVNFNAGGAADTKTSVSNGPDTFFEKFDSATGNELFTYAPGGTGFDFASGVAVDSKGNIFGIGGYQSTVGFPVNGSVVTLFTPANTNGFFVLELSPAGTALMARSLNGFTTNSNTGTPSIAVNSSGTLAIAFTYTGASGAAGLPTPPTPAGGSDILVEILDKNGNVLQQASAGGSGDDTASGVAITNAGRVSAVGTYVGPATFGSTVLQTKYSAGLGSNIFVAGVNPPVVTPGDFKGIGTTQVSVYRVSTAGWYVQGLPAATLAPFGIPNQSLPVPGDYAGIGTTQQAFYSTFSALWTYKAADGSTQPLGFFGWAGHDIPVPGDYDGIGRTELAVYRPGTGEWFVLSPGGGRKLPNNLGTPGLDIPVPADYTGAGVTQQAVYRPTTAEWFVAGQSGVFAQFGWAGHDIPVPGNYLNTGKSVPAVYRPDTAQWFVKGNPGIFTQYGWATPNGVRPMNDFPSLARLGTIRGLPQFNGDGSISGFSLKGGGGIGGFAAAASASVPVVSTPSAGVKVAITPSKALPKISFAKGQSRRFSLGQPAKVTG